MTARAMRAAEAAWQAATTDEALAIAVGLICEEAGWPVGHAYGVDHGELRSLDAWHLEHPRYEPFRGATDSRLPRESAPGRVARSGQAEWLEDMSVSPSFLRRRAIEVTGLRTGACVPVRAGEVVAAVLEFFSDQAPPIDATTRQLFLDSGQSLGMVIEAKRLQGALDVSEALRRGVFEGPQPLGVLGGGLTVAAANAALLDLLGTNAERVLGSQLEAHGAEADDRDRLRCLAGDLGSARVERAEMQCSLRRGDATPIWARIRAWVDPHGGPEPGFFCLIEPLTDRRPEERADGDRAETLGEALRDLASIDELRRVLAAAIAAAAHLARAEYAAIGLLRPDQTGYASYHHTTPEGVTELDSASVAGLGVLEALRLESRPLHIENLAGHPAFAGFPPGQPPAATFLGLPLAGEGTAIGHLLLTRTASAPFSPADEALAGQIAAATAAAVRRARAEQQVHVLRNQSQRLVRANLALVRQLRPGSLLRWAVHDVRSLLNADFAALLLTDGPDDDAVGTFVHSGLAQGAAAAIEATAPHGAGLFRAAMLARRPTRLRDLRRHPAHAGFPKGHPPITTFVASPIIRDAEVIGLLFAGNKRGASEFSDDDERFIGDLSAELGRTHVSPETASPDLVDRIASTSQALRAEMEATRTFLGSLSHELRGSISGIMVSSELLSDPSFGILAEDQVRALGMRIHTVARSLLGLVDNLLDLARLEAGRLDVILQPVDMAAVIDDVEAVITSLAENMGVAVQLPSMAQVPRVLGDPVRLRQVLLNLFTNSVKFTAAGGRAWLEIDTSARDEIVLAVCDTGRGIAGDQLERIFEPFQRAAGTNIPGVGLGLAISRRIIDLHGSRLEVASWPEVGSRFSFALRTSRDPLPPRLLRPPTEPSAATGSDGRQASVLIVEDDAVNRQSIGDVLTRAGYRVRSVTTRAAAIEAVREVAPDAITLDVQLPDGNGLEIVATLRSLAEPADLAIVALSADRIGNTAERAMLAGCDRFALKPIAARDLLGLVRSALEERRSS